MTINPGAVVGKSLPPIEAEWASVDVILYHLALGAGNPPTSSSELAYTYESDLKVLPSFAVVSALESLSGLFSIPGLEINPATILHGEQSLSVSKPLPIEARVTHQPRIAAIYDKGKGALIDLETETREKANGELLAVSRWGIFARGAGGFGGDPGPKAGAPQPEDPSDLEFTITTLPQQALLYRLTGDKNPLHADPQFAAAVGFERPILHGLCTYGMVLKGLVDHALEGKVDAISDYSARFAGVLYPGETITVRVWKGEDGVSFAARCAQRNESVLTHGRLGIRALAVSTP